MPDLRSLHSLVCSLPAVSRDRRFSMSEIEAAIKTQGNYVSPVLLELGAGGAKGSGVRPGSIIGIGCRLLPRIVALDYITETTPPIVVKVAELSSRIKTCFISATAGTHLEILREVLAAKGVEVLVPEEPGSNWATDFASIVSHVDLVIGVLTRERRSTWVLFELGQAVALKSRRLSSPLHTIRPFRSIYSGSQLCGSL